MLAPAIAETRATPIRPALPIMPTRVMRSGGAGGSGVREGWGMSALRPHWARSADAPIILNAAGRIAALVVAMIFFGLISSAILLDFAGALD